MKRLSATLLAATFFMFPALDGSGPVVPGAYAAQTNFTAGNRRTNFTSARSRAGQATRNTRPAPARSLDLWGIFAPGRTRDVQERPVRQPQQGPQPIARIRPEPAKIYEYPRPRTVVLQGDDLGPVPADPAAAAIHRVLAEGMAEVPVIRTHAKAIIDFYRKRNFAPVWTTAAAVQERAFDVVALLTDAADEGLDPALYRVPVVWEVNGDLAAITQERMRLARFDVELTALALRYAVHASGGQVDPNKLSAYHDLKPPRVKPAAALRALAERNDAAAWLAGLHPVHRAYGIFKRELARLRAAARGERPLPAIPRGPVIRPGQFDERIPLIRQYLERAGVLNEGERTSRQEASGQQASDRRQREAFVLNDGRDEAYLYTPGLVRAVKAYQRRHGLAPDGIIGPRTLARLNAMRNNTAAARIRKLELNMERLRWMPRNFGREHFLVNQPAYEVYLIRDGRTVWKSRVVIGKPKNQTAFFSDVMEYMEFNPYWGVPQSIITKEMMPKLLRDPGWLDKQGYELYDRKGRRISSWDVDWTQYIGQSKVPFDVRQPPGEKNALGRMKFMFPNAHAIYMHDTPMRHLFKRRKRAYSHGCVRVAKPWEMAQLVTGLSYEEIHRHVASGKNHKLNLPRKIPVHLAYFTAWPDDEGRIHYYEDVYGRDRLLRKALTKVRKALKVPVPESMPVTEANLQID